MVAWMVDSTEKQCMAALACAAALGGLHAIYVWHFDRCLPQGIRYRTDGPFGRNGHYVITDINVVKRNAKVLVHPTAGARVYMGGMRETNILCSPAGLWERQRAIIHPFIASHARQYLALLQQTDLTLPEADDVDLLEAVGGYVSHISTAAMGLTIKGGFKWGNVSRAVLGISTLLALGVPEGLLRAILRLVLPFTHLEQQIAKFVDESDSDFVCDLITEFGRHEAIGHIWGIVNGSIIPETNIICSIMHDIAADRDLQAKLYDMVCKDTPETVVCNKSFEAFIAQKCREHAFFRSTSRVVQEDFHVQGCTIPKGASMRIPIAKFNDSSGTGLTWGFGPRSCPGAIIGKNIVKVTVFRLLRSYSIDLRQEPFKLKTDTVNMYPFGMRMTYRKRSDQTLVCDDEQQ